MRNFDIVTKLIELAGKIQARRVARLKAREANLMVAIDSACKALTATVKDRQEAEKRKIGE